MAKMTAAKTKKDTPMNIPFTMTVELNGATISFDTFPSSWLMNMDSLDDDYLMTEQEFLNKLEEEWEISTVSGVFNMIYEGNLLGDLLESASVEVKVR